MADGKVQCTIVTPEKAFLDQTVDHVVLPMFDGELGVYPGRESLVGRLGPGELRLTTGDKTEAFFIDGGFAQVRANVVTVLTAKAQPLATLDAAKAAAELAAAQALPADSTLDREKKQKAVARATAQTRLVDRKTV